MKHSFLRAAALLLAGCYSGASVYAGPTNTPGSQHQAVEIGAHKNDAPKPVTSPDDERPVEPTQPLGLSPEEQAFVHVHAGAKTCAGVLVDARLVYTSRHCTGEGAGSRGHEGDLRVQVPSGRLAWAHRKVEAWVAPSCPRTALDVALLVLAEAVDTKPIAVSSAPGVGTRVRSPGYGACGDVPAGMRAGAVLERGVGAMRVDAALCASDTGAPVIDSGGQAFGIVVRAGHETGAPAHDDPDHPRRHTADAARLDAAAPRALLARARRILSGDAAAVDAATPCD
ncbi:MAG: trypsin-like serine protease [Deltaproteobacteria bacterium]|nr:trypsin-like serine protease [Deltaproteobacteria bacterium]